MTCSGSKGSGHARARHGRRARAVSGGHRNGVVAPC